MWPLFFLFNQNGNLMLLLGRTFSGVCPFTTHFVLENINLNGLLKDYE
jgi:hypothetical protein